MQHGFSAYASVARTAQAAIPSRELEAELLIKAAAHLQAIADDWAGRSGELDAALAYNRKLWTVLATTVTNPENPLPVAIKLNILNLANFIFKESFRISVESTPEGLTTLVGLNRDVAAGLRGR